MNLMLKVRFTLLYIIVSKLLCIRVFTLQLTGAAVRCIGSGCAISIAEGCRCFGNSHVSSYPVIRCCAWHIRKDSMVYVTFFQLRTRDACVVSPLTHAAQFLAATLP